MSDSQPSYVIRWKGVVLGPFTLDKIMNDLRDGRVSLMHQVETPDGWVPLRTILDEEEERRKKSARQEAEKLMQAQKLQAERASQHAKPAFQAPPESTKPSFANPLDDPAESTSQARLNQLSSRLPGMRPQTFQGFPPPPPQPRNYPPPPPPPPPQGIQRPDAAFQSHPHVVVRPPNYMVSAILSTLFCCLPFGIVSIVYAAQVDSKFSAGDYDGANRASQSAKGWYHAALICGLLLGIFWVVASQMR